MLHESFTLERETYRERGVHSWGNTKWKRSITSHTKEIQIHAMFKFQRTYKRTKGKGNLQSNDSKQRNKRMNECMKSWVNVWNLPLDYDLSFIFLVFLCRSFSVFFSLEIWSSNSRSRQSCPHSWRIIVIIIFLSLWTFSFSKQTWYSSWFLSASFPIAKQCLLFQEMRGGSKVFGQQTRKGIQYWIW